MRSRRRSPWSCCSFHSRHWWRSICSNAGASVSNRQRHDESMSTNGITPARKVVRHDPWFVRLPLIVFAALFLGIMVVGPLANVFTQGFALGWHVVAAALQQPDALHALKLTVIASVCAVIFNLTFGLAAA